MTESKLLEGDVRQDLPYNPLLLQASQVQACGVHVLYLPSDLQQFHDINVRLRLEE